LRLLRSLHIQLFRNAKRTFVPREACRAAEEGRAKPVTEIERLRANAQRCIELAKLATEKVMVDMLTKLARKYSKRAHTLALTRALAKSLFPDDAQ